MKILISAGHQPGLDSGALGQLQQEADNNIMICDRVVLYLRSWGVDTIYMPNNIGGLQEEINWANANLKEGQGYAIQIHRNAGGGTGNEVWTTAYANQIPLATSIMNAMTQITGLKSRGVKDIKTHNLPLGWINYVKAESVLVEARFIDVDDISDVSDYLDAYSIACGIADFLQVARRPSIEQQQIIDCENARIAQVNAKAESDRLFAIAEQVRLEAKLALEAKQKADADAKIAEEKANRALEEKILTERATAEAEKALKDAISISDKDDKNFISWLKDILITISKAIIGWRK